MVLSVVIPVYNEAENLRPLVSQVFDSIEKSVAEFEVIIVDDGSTDETFVVASALAKDNFRLKLIRLRRNFGQTAAMVAGFASARGDVIVPMDGDLQNDPNDIPRLLEKIAEGYDVVSGWRKDRQDRLLSRRLPSVLANRLISRMTGVHLHDYGCTLKAYRSEVLRGINLYGEMHRFVPALVSQFGAQVVELPVNHRPRIAGKSKYGIDRTLRVILDLITVKFMLKYSTRPMQLFGKWGVGVMACGVLSGAVTLGMKWFEGLPMNRNPLLILTAFLLFSGVQFLMLGLLGEIITRTYHETQDKPIYTIRETVNL